MEYYTIFHSNYFSCESEGTKINFKSGKLIGKIQIHLIFNGIPAYCSVFDKIVPSININWLLQHLDSILCIHFRKKLLDEVL